MWTYLFYSIFKVVVITDKTSIVASATLRKRQDNQVQGFTRNDTLNYIRFSCIGTSFYTPNLEEY